VTTETAEHSSTHPAQDAPERQTLALVLITNFVRIVRDEEVLEGFSRPQGLDASLTVASSNIDICTSPTLFEGPLVFLAVPF
jgi:hypothetical protein